jgi:putative NIF3 family GTP cyclohydrolase 1 type 2
VAYWQLELLATIKTICMTAEQADSAGTQCRESLSTQSAKLNCFLAITSVVMPKATDKYKPLLAVHHSNACTIPRFAGEVCARHARQGSPTLWVWL